MEVNVELHEMINEYVNSVKLEDIHEELDKLQSQYNILHRVERDIWHMIEFGENLSSADKLGIYDLLEKTLRERRYIKNILRRYMNPEMFERLVKNGTIGRGHRRYVDIEEGVDTSKFNDCKYAPRSANEDNRVEDFIKSTYNYKLKFKGFESAKSEEELSLLKRLNN